MSDVSLACFISPVKPDGCNVLALVIKCASRAFLTDPGLLKIRHSHRFVAVVIQFLIHFEIVCKSLARFIT